MVRATVLLLGTMLGLIVHGAFSGLPEAQSAPSSHHISGTVIAMTADQQPRTIVLRAGTGVNEVIVAAVVGDRVTIRRGKASIAMRQLLLGETVQLTYQKTRAGLVAMSIIAQ